MRSVNAAGRPLTSEAPGFRHLWHLVLRKCVSGPYARRARSFLRLQSTRRAKHNDLYRDVKISWQTLVSRAGCLLGTFAVSFLEIPIKKQLS